MRKIIYRSITLLIILIVIFSIASCAKKQEEKFEPGEIMSNTPVKSKGFTEPEGCT
ncbi:hypothetical protein [Candidatus Oleimmundimicrobium sp.]|uniref:hypothetical protein n=1 Tax=Candidatus Oleimmundimicrobium sp. TaxID=3060597 RepID=UPI0027194742|nr:hypothetical protein [Candidatus Oleimmundimicrobium sp.]MDO8886911.1 hypothetical protein [Candidatus Oleimmundimicrobium sp.]